MLNNLLAIVKGDGSSWAGQTQSPSNYYFDNFGEPFLYALIGFIVVFVGIALIIGIIWLVGFILKKVENGEFLKKKNSKKAESIEDKQADVENNDEVPDEVKAAIIAAIMAYYEDKQEKCEFTVKRIKRI